MQRIILIVFSVLLLWACNNTPKQVVETKPRVFPQYHMSLDEIIKTNDGVIRGINLNSKADSIKKLEKQQAIEADKDRLYFEYTIDSLTNYSIEYTLLNDSLEEISVQVNCNDPDVGSKIFNDLKDY